MLLALGHKSCNTIFKVFEVKHHQVAIKELKKLFRLLFICFKRYLALEIMISNSSVHFFTQKLK